MEAWLLDLVEHLGYIGIFLATLIESTFVPIPAEVTMIPAGILVAKGQMNYWLVLVSGSAGVLAGSIVNYWLGVRFGRALIIKHGRYLFLKPSFLEKTEHFFAKYGRMAVFIGRLLPGIKHYISFVAGIAKMRFRPFVTFTAFGGVIWIWILLQVGYMAEIQADKNPDGFGGVELIVTAICVITAVVWIIKEKMMKH